MRVLLRCLLFLGASKPLYSFHLLLKHELYRAFSFFYSHFLRFLLMSGGVVDTWGIFILNILAAARVMMSGLGGNSRFSRRECS